MYDISFYGCECTYLTILTSITTPQTPMTIPHKDNLGPQRGIFAEILTK